MLESGAILQDRYKIDAQIGKGGMGAVYRARDLRLRTDVALKETLFTDAAYRRAFEQEAQILARLRHQFLPRVIDHFIDRNGQFLVMEFIHGEDLGSKLAHLGRRFASPQVMPIVLRWTDQLLDVLHYLHTRPAPVFHRDVKPKNLKLTTTNDVILLDFGLARGGMTVNIDLDAVEAENKGRRVYGFTPPYAPLEQMRDGEPDARGDIYALAATVYHLLTGVLPLDAMLRMAKLVQGQPDPLKPIVELAPHVPPAIADLIQQAMSVTSDGRPASARAMREALQRLRGAARVQPAAAAALPATPVGLAAQPVAQPSPAPISEPQPAPITPSAIGSITPSIVRPAGAPANQLGTLLRMLTTGSPVRSVAFSPSGDLLAAGYDDHTVGLWRLHDFAHLGNLRGHTSTVRSVSFAPVGGLLASASDDESVRLWQVSDGAPRRQLRVPGCPVESIAFSPDGKLLAVGGWGTAITLCQVEDERLDVMASLPGPFVHSLSFSPDGQLLVAGGYDGSLYLWHPNNQQALPPLSGFTNFILSVAFSPDGQLLAASSHSTVRIWRMSDQRPIEQLRGHSGPIHGIAFSPDGQVLATGSEDKQVRLWRVSDGTPLPEPLEHRAGVASLAYSPDGRMLATGSRDGRICLWAVGG